MKFKKENIFIVFSTALISLIFYVGMDKFFLDNGIVNKQYSTVAESADNSSAEASTTSTSTGILPPGDPTNYTDNKNGTITDNYTKLIWKKCPQGLSGNNCQSGGVTLRNWAKSRSECESLNFAGKTGWRLPTLKELESIVDTSSNEIMINENFFKGTENPYWAYDYPADYKGNKFTVVFSNGTVYLQGDGNVAAVRCVHD